MTVDLGLKNKVALISGANNPMGIGAATALAFAQEGAKIVIVYKKLDMPFDEKLTARNGTTSTTRRTAVMRVRLRSNYEPTTLST